MTLKSWVLFSLLPGLLVACSGSPQPPTAAATPQPVNPQPTTPSSSPSQKLVLNEVPEINDLVQKTLTDEGPGVAVLVLKNNQILHAQGYGFANIKTRQPITPATNFDLASVSKQVTAIAVLKLVQAGTIDLDASIKTYLPDFHHDSITVRHLLYHTSGLADYTGAEWTGTDAEFAELDLERHLEWLNQQEVQRPPGQKFEYNNSGYALLALIVQRVAQKPFWKFAEADLFAPLGMTQTQILHQTGQVIPNLALGYLVTDNGTIKQSSSPSIIQGDGNVFSSILDLAQYDIALRTGRLIPAKLKAEAFSTGQLDNGKLIESEGEGYGMGWSVTDNYVHHSGSWSGTSTYYRHYLQQPITIIVLSNDENYEPSDLVDQIADYLKL